MQNDHPDRTDGYRHQLWTMAVATGTTARLTTEASVFINLVDVERRKLTWQGVAVIDVNDKVATQLRDAIYTSVNRVLAQYPHTAGN